VISNVNAGARLDRLPIGPLHRRLLWLVGLGMLFDTFDNTLSSSVLAALLGAKWSTLELNSLFMAATFLGLTVGAAFVGWMSDRYGRLLAYQFNLLVFGLMSFASALAPSMHWMIAIRFVMGVGMGAEYVMGYGLVAEFMPPGRRGRYLGWLGLISGAGVSISALTGMVVIPRLGWRAMFIIGGIGTLWVWWLRRHLPESPRWLERVGRGVEANEILERIEQEAVSQAALPPIVVVPSHPIPKVSIAVLFSPPVMRRTLVALVINVTCLVGSYSVTAWMP
jgi:MFS transporter, putative metabolite:H+ symporter